MDTVYQDTDVTGNILGYVDTDLFIDRVRSFKRCVNEYNDYCKRAKQIAKKYHHACNFDVDYIDYDDASNELIVYGDETFRGCSEPVSYSFPIEVLFYNDDELDKYGEYLKAEEERLKKKQKMEDEQKRLANERAEYERLKAKFEGVE